MSTPADFATSLTSVAVAQLLLMSGIDRVHTSANGAVVELAETMLTLLSKKVMQATLLCGRTKPCILDILPALDYLQINPEELSEYIDILEQTKKPKDRTEPVYKFPRLEPGPFPVSLELIPLQQHLKADAEDFDLEMDVDENHVVPTMQPFPPMPSQKDEDHLLQLIHEAEVPKDIEEDVMEPQIEVADLKQSNSMYYTSVPFEGIEGIDSELLDFSDPPEPVAPSVDMEAELFLAFENFRVDPKIRPPISDEDLLTLLTFKSGPGVAVATDSSAGYESRSLINELLLLRMPGLHTIFGGEKIIGMEAQIQGEINSLSKGRKKEKERDSGQGKAPVKMSAARLAKIQAQAEARRAGMSEYKAKRDAMAAIASLAPRSDH